MPFQIIRNNIINMDVDVIVNSTSTNANIIGGAEGVLIKAGGKDLFHDRQNLGSIDVSEVRYTLGYDLSAKYVIHTVGPVYTGNNDDEQLLKRTYINILKMAERLNCDSIAFPLISTGLSNYPKREALNIVNETVKEFLNNSDMMIYLVVYDNKSYGYSKEIFSNVKSYIDNNYKEKRRSRDVKAFMQMNVMHKSMEVSIDLDNSLLDIDKGFSETLLELIENTGKKPAEIYKKANVTRKLFSKIKTNPYYHPSKQIASAFAIALELNLVECKDLLQRAGYTLSKSIKFDVIIEYCIINKIYDIYEVNEILFEWDQNLLGSSMN